MKERPILFSGPMVRALLEGRKCQTRRVVKPQPVDHDEAEPGDAVFFGGVLQKVRESRGRDKAAAGMLNCHDWNPYGVPGDRLFVRETWADIPLKDGSMGYAYRADDADGDGSAAYEDIIQDGYDLMRWRPSIHMPRRACRITLEVTRVRVERVQDITEADAVAEGVVARSGGPDFEAVPAADVYSELWDSINGAGSWARNDWTWAIDFKRIGGAS